MLDWDDLRFYLVAAQAGTGTAAAEKLRVSRTTVTRRVEALERALGVSLFETTAAGTGSTEAGRLVLACARDLDSRIAALRAALSLADAHPDVVRIALPAELGLEALTLYQTLAGDIAATIRLEFVQSPLPAAALQERSAVIGLCVGDTLPAHLRGRSIGTLRMAPYAVHGANPARLPWIGLGKDLVESGPARWMTAHVPAERIALRVNTGAEVREAVRRGLGIGYLWDDGSDGPLGCRRAEQAGPVIADKLWLAMHEDVPPSPAVRAVLARLEDILGRSLAA
ncbi:LysR family transcriptional regulator [Caenibius sp. WL]|uniref:LysR family transcriptional regulator n=1 Tax=Caenibius sp. WL TaxID=2872646 RepID=UPI001C998414|nr:LysR family transcriptional regulator [Caenibius sp. WL]QZP09407.1 LysR family transcriptional regulator [Caenibius sp. WL]